MSSSLIVEVCRIEKITPLEGADFLEICLIKGWECIVKKDTYKVGDLVIYIPVDSILPVELADRLNVRNYLKGKNSDRVGCVKLRQEMSYGLIIDNENNWEEGYDCAEDLGITKYVPPIRMTAGDAASEDAFFDKFVDIENIRNFPNVFEEGEMVVITEKADGTNSRNGWEINENLEIEWKAGSHKVKRKKPDTEEEMKSNTYWYPQTLPSVKNLLTHILNSKMAVKTATLYGEIYGKVRGGHKSMHYGAPDSLNFAAFALKIDGKYVVWETFLSLCLKFDVPRVPLIDIIPFNIDKVKDLSKGKSLLAAKNGADHIREGVVVCSLNERRDPSIGRAILKVINPDYLIMKNKKESKGEEVDFKDE